MRIVGPAEVPQAKIKDYAELRHFVNATSRSTKKWSRGLSPFYLGPCEVHGGRYTSHIMENAWQFTKVFPGYEFVLSFYGAFEFDANIWSRADMKIRRQGILRKPIGTGRKRAGRRKSPFDTRWEEERSPCIAGTTERGSPVRFEF